MIDENGALCGLICAALQDDDPNASPVSYAATLWPMLQTEISADRGDAYPRGVTYPLIDLVRDNILHAVGLEELDQPFPRPRIADAIRQITHYRFHYIPTTCVSSYVSFPFNWCSGGLVRSVAAVWLCRREKK